MTFAYLILAHKNPSRLLRMVDALTADGTYFFIHVDKKTDETPFKSIIGERENVFFCERRKTVNRAGFSLVEATMELIREMIIHAGIPDYVHLMSGQDFPIKSNEYIFNYFERNRGTNFIEYFSLPSEIWNDGMERIRYKWYVDDVGYVKATELIRKQKTRDFLPDIVPYGGATWWSLTGECVAHIFSECNQGSQMHEFYRYTVSPDEMLFHTFLMNSKFKDTVKNYSLRKMDWSAGQAHPKTWKREDFGELITSPRLFARKFDADIDSEILDRLEMHITDGYNHRKKSEVPAVSVVMSMYNADKFLRECMDSILAQTFTDFELIIADDGSSDNSVETVKSYRDNRIKLVVGEHDFINSLNTAMSHAKGKYIARMDADDIMPVDRLEVQYEFMEKNPETDVCVGWMQFFGHSTHLEKIPADHDKIENGLIRRNFIMNPTAMIKREILSNNNIKYERDYPPAEDYKLWVDLIRAECHFAGMQRILNFYRTHACQLTVTGQEEMRKSAFRIQMEYVEYLMELIAGKNKRYFKLINSLIEAVNEDLIPFKSLADTVGIIHGELSEKESRTNGHLSIKKYLTDNYRKIIDKYRKIKPYSAENTKIEEAPVWVCWWDGEQAMPDIVKACYRSVCNNAETHPVRLITKYNCREFITVPDCIIDKVDRGIISITHLSDILRMCLLHDYGGLWTDATVFVTGKFRASLFEQDLFTIRNSVAISFDTEEYCWTTFFIGGTKGNPFFAFMRDILCEYWKKEETLIHYFLMDYCIGIAYDKMPVIRSMIEKIPYSNPQMFGICQNLDKEFDIELYNRICSDTDFHKLTWKKKF
ncbi:MAG: glycosyltransferase, partial [Prevotellaceae bacterium]|nr:glycosyltransferase [Prevotellaceae bacterium]